MFERQKALYEELTKLCNGKLAGDIKGATINLLVTTLMKNSSSIDEAIVQWNEMSLKFERVLRARWNSNISLPDQFDLQKVRFNGDK